MKRDNPFAKTGAEINKYTLKHPYFSENYSSPRYGNKGLYCCGKQGNNNDYVERNYNIEHPKIIKSCAKYPYLKTYAKNMNDYMENHWQYHNHLSHERHQNRIRYTSTFCKGTTLEVGSANGYSTFLMQQANQAVKFTGVEATDWGYREAIKTYPSIKFYKAYGGN